MCKGHMQFSRHFPHEGTSVRLCHPLRDTTSGTAHAACRIQLCTPNILYHAQIQGKGGGQHNQPNKRHVRGMQGLQHTIIIFGTNVFKNVSGRYYLHAGYTRLARTHCKHRNHTL
uniref:Uncharacterized protein n=1 Tax=Dunaliella tertiolecta TaxID=3047 RepID=A0A7S3RA21_DUNTE